MHGICIGLNSPPDRGGSVFRQYGSGRAPSARYSRVTKSGKKAVGNYAANPWILS
jgi:hypothetical protein